MTRKKLAKPSKPLAIETSDGSNFDSQKPIAYRFDWPAPLSMGARRFAGADDPIVERLMRNPDCTVVPLYSGPNDKELIQLLSDILEDLSMRAKMASTLKGKEYDGVLNISNGLVRRMYMAITPKTFNY